MSYSILSLKWKGDIYLFKFLLHSFCIMNLSHQIIRIFKLRLRHGYPCIKLKIACSLLFYLLLLAHLLLLVIHILHNFCFTLIKRYCRKWKYYWTIYIYIYIWIIFIWFVKKKKARPLVRPWSTPSLLLIQQDLFLKFYS